MNFRERMEADFRRGAPQGEDYSSSFGGALSALKSGRRVCRSGWNGKGMWIELVDNWSAPTPAGVGEMAPFIAMKTADNKFVPWLCSQTDMLADDWQVLPESDAGPGQPA